MRRELWTTLLGYNLIRTTAAAAAALHDKQPRQISFTATCQYVLASWLTFSTALLSLDERLARCRTMLAQIANSEVANRPGRIEPRELKRRRHRYKLMQEPRTILRAAPHADLNSGQSRRYNGDSAIRDLVHSSVEVALNRATCSLSWCIRRRRQQVHLSGTMNY